MIGRRKSGKDESRPGARHRRAQEGYDDEAYDEAAYDEAAYDEGYDESPEDSGDGYERVDPLRGGGRQGPWDSADVPDPAAGNRLDLGGLWLPGIPGMELRLEIEEQSGAVLSAVCVVEQSAVQLRALAAPRSGGLWQEMRADMAHELREQGGDAREADGPFGPEIHAVVPAAGPDGRPVPQEVRFAGIEGPRWLLQAIFTGAAVNDPFAAAPLENLVRDVVVVRGPGPMARGEMLELRLPPQTPPGPRGGENDQPAREPLNPFARGPEITEIR